MLNYQVNKLKKVTLFLIFSSILILVPSFLLLMASSWNSDDYNTAKPYQVEGLYDLYHRIFNWSPRFFSEIILYVYYNAVPWLGKPFTGAMILITWLFLLFSVFIFIRNTISQHSLFFQDKEENSAKTKTKQEAENIYLKILLPLLLTLILFTYFLYCYLPSEMYYLVIVSVPYVSTLAGIILTLKFFINQANSSSISRSNIFQFILFGVITSSSWEMGAVYHFFFSLSLFLILFLTSFSSRLNHLPFSHLDKLNRWKLAIANLIPFSLSLYIFFLLKVGRLTGIDPSSIGSPFVDKFKVSFITSVLQFFKEVFFLNNPPWENNDIDLYSFTYSLVYKLGFLFLLAIIFCLAKIKFNTVTRNACFISIILLLITNFITTFSGYYELGISSPGRQMNFKLALIGLIILILALIISSLISSPKTLYQYKKININSVMNSPITLLISFCLSFILLINLQFNNLKRDIFNLNNIIIANNQNWQSNLHCNKELATYIQIATYYIFRMSFEPGLYHKSEKIELENYRQTAYMNYFNKKRLKVIPFTYK